MSLPTTPGPASSGTKIPAMTASIMAAGTMATGSMTAGGMTTSDVTARADAVVAAVTTRFLGREAAVRLAFGCLLADGHLLIEDTPGSGKTALSAALAAVLGLDFQRVQCTNDLLPADITGLSIFDRESGHFVMREGPVFTQMLLADELNRAPSKTQSALLQAMEERVVTVDRETRALPRPFLVIATQNPAEQIGTFDLPESHLDRFSLSMDIGRPDHATQAAILTGRQDREQTAVPQVLTGDELLVMQALVASLPAVPEVIDYALRVADTMEGQAAVTLSVRFRAQFLRLGAFLRRKQGINIVGERHRFEFEMHRVETRAKKDVRP